MSDLKKYRKFGERRYILAKSRIKRKSDAEKYARGQRKKGRNAQIEKHSSGYAVYTVGMKQPPAKKPAPKKAKKPSRPRAERDEKLPRHVPPKKPLTKLTSPSESRKYSKKRDAGRPAMKGGKRKAKSGRTYYETRKNRADDNPNKRL